MPRPPVQEHIVQEILRIWLSDPMLSLSGAEVHRRYRRNARSNDISVRKVQQIIAEHRAVIVQNGWKPTEWRPWLELDETAEDSNYLLQLDSLSLQIRKHHLYQHEARWARRLRVALNELSLILHWMIVYMYGVREEVERLLNRPEIYTEDLDGYVMFKPWKPGGKDAYDSAVSNGLIPPLNLAYVNGVVPFPQIDEWLSDPYITLFSKTQSDS